MKRKTQTYSKDFKMPHLFREDLEVIEDIIKNELKPQEYKIETNEFEYDNIQEILGDTKTKSTNRLFIQTYQPLIFKIYLIDKQKSSPVHDEIHSE